MWIVLQTPNISFPMSWVTQNVIAFHSYLRPKIVTVPLRPSSIARYVTARAMFSLVSQKSWSCPSRPFLALWSLLKAETLLRSTTTTTPHHLLLLSCILNCLKARFRSACLQLWHHAKQSGTAPLLSGSLQLSVWCFCWGEGEVPSWVLALDLVPATGMCWLLFVTEQPPPERWGKARGMERGGLLPFSLWLPTHGCLWRTPSWWRGHSVILIFSLSLGSFVPSDYLLLLFACCCFACLYTGSFFTYTHLCSFPLIDRKGLVKSKGR